MMYFIHSSYLKHFCCLPKKGGCPPINQTQNAHHPFIFQSLHQLHQNKEKTSVGADIAFKSIVIVATTKMPLAIVDFFQISGGVVRSLS